MLRQETSILETRREVPKQRLKSEHKLFDRLGRSLPPELKTTVAALLGETVSTEQQTPRLGVVLVTQKASAQGARNAPRAKRMTVVTANAKAARAV
jgi:hypothetical protein